MTNQRVYSLKEQTLNVIRDLKSPITLVSLYSHSDQDPRRDWIAPRPSRIYWMSIRGRGMTSMLN